MRLLVPIILVLAGLASGVGAGILLRPGAECPAGDCEDSAAEKSDELPVTYEYVELDKQFVVPVMSEDGVAALIVLSLSVEVTPDDAPTVEQRKPKMRDAFLQVLFRHAQSGGFDGAFTTGQPMRDLRLSLAVAARDLVGEGVKGVLVTDVVRQDM